MQRKLRKNVRWGKSQEMESEINSVNYYLLKRLSQSYNAIHKEWNLLYKIFLKIFISCCAIATQDHSMLSTNGTTTEFTIRFNYSVGWLRAKRYSMHFFLYLGDFLAVMLESPVRPWSRAANRDFVKFQT